MCISISNIYLVNETDVPAYFNTEDQISMWYVIILLSDHPQQGMCDTVT
jgi:hypothetical protein